MISGGGKLEIKYGMLFRGDIYILVFEQEFSISNGFKQSHLRSAYVLDGFKSCVFMPLKDLPASYYGGLSGLQLPVPKYQFPAPYQDVSRLTYYATFFNSIEINSSFYKVPQAATMRKWQTQVPDYFNFTFKLWKQITHCNGMNFEKNDVAQFLNAIASIGNKRGCLLIQFPPGLGIEARSQLEKLLHTIKELDTVSLWKVAIEFRNKSWHEDIIYELL